MTNGLRPLNRGFIGLIFPVAAISLFLLSSCFPGQSNKNSAGITTGIDSVRLSHFKVPDNVTFSTVLEDLDKRDPQNIDKAITLFSNTIADSLSRDSMLVSLNEYMTAVMQNYFEAKIMGDHELTELFRNGEEQEEAQKRVRMLASHGIRLAFRDGEFYLEPDLEFIYGRLKDVISAGSTDYLLTKISLGKTMKNEHDKPVSVPDSLARHIVAWEDFMDRNPGFLLTDDIQILYMDAFSTYLSGTDQAPLFDPSTKLLNPSYQASYLRYLETNPGRESTKIISSFYDLLTSKEYKYDEAVDTFLTEINFIPSQVQP